VSKGAAAVESRVVRVLGLIGAGILLVAAASPAVAEPSADALATSARPLAVQRVKTTEKALRPKYYTYFASEGRWRCCGPTGWTSGYFPGELWAAYSFTGDSWFSKHAASRQAAIGKSAITTASTDIGIRTYYSYARGFDLTGNPAFLATALNGARGEAARYNPIARVVQSRNATRTCPVIIDELMNLRILYWGSEHGGPPIWAEIAHQHALTAAHEFVRPDGSVYHIAHFDLQTGEVTSIDKGQGFSVDSTWARGQAWAVHGFSAAYRHTGDTTLLDTARRVADRYLAELPADMVPYWDFRAPEIPIEPRDSSAAAVAASGLLDLAMLDPDASNRARYATAAKQIIAALASPAYFSAKKGPALLQHGTMSYYAPETTDTGQSHGDYFFMEALERLRLLPAGTGLPIRSVRASRGNPYLAVDGTSTTSWTSSGSQWIEFDLGQQRTASAVTLAVRWGDTRSAGFKVRVSNDRRHWKQVASFRSGGEFADPETQTFKPVQARYVRVICNGTTSGKANGITEAAVH
jgi:unsaturated chondroitin disaccharide hydrolase